MDPIQGIVLVHDGPGTRDSGSCHTISHMGDDRLTCRGHAGVCTKVGMMWHATSALAAMLKDPWSLTNGGEQRGVERREEEMGSATAWFNRRW